MLSERTFRFTKKSTVSRNPFLQRPKSFRMVMKSRSGYIQNLHQDFDRSESKLNLNATQNSFTETNLSQAKKIGHTETGHEELGQNRQPKIQLPTLSPNHIQQQQQHQQDISSIEALGKEVDALLQLKLEQAADHIHENGRTQVEEIDRRINKIVRYLQEEKQVENIERAERKIQILDKIMAESAIESEIAKKYYLKKISNAKQRVPDLLQLRLNQKAKQLREQTRSLLHKNMPISIHYQSINQSNYLPPAKDSYPSRQPRQQYQANNQPMPRSSYGRDYLTYGALPKFRHKDNDATGIPSCSIGKKSSSYQDNFTVKKIEKINFKQLDCYQDKFKNLKIPLIHESSRPLYFMQQPLTHKTLENPELSPAHLSNKELLVRVKTEHYNPHYIESLSTENKVNYKGESNGLKSEIKNKKYNKYKYAYKSYVHA